MSSKELIDGNTTAKKAATHLANAVLVASGLACAGAIAYFFYHYQWLHDRHYSGLGGPLLYYVTPVFLIIVCFGALFLRSDTRITLAAVLISLGGSVYLMEGLLKLRDYVARTWPTEINRQNYADRAEVAKRFGIDFDSRSRLEVLRDLH